MPPSPPAWCLGPSPVLSPHSVAAQGALGATATFPRGQGRGCCPDRAQPLADPGAGQEPAQLGTGWGMPWVGGRRSEPVPALEPPWALVGYTGHRARLRGSPGREPRLSVTSPLGPRPLTWDTGCNGTRPRGAARSARRSLGPQHALRECWSSFPGHGSPQRPALLPAASRVAVGRGAHWSARSGFGEVTRLWASVSQSRPGGTHLPGPASVVGQRRSTSTPGSETPHRPSQGPACVGRAFTKPSDVQRQPPVWGGVWTPSLTPRLLASDLGQGAARPVSTPHWGA